MSIRTTWIGARGNAFFRVCLAFEAMGYKRPRPDQITGGVAEGGFATNIAAQYVADMTENQALAVIAWALRSTVTELSSRVGDYTLEDIESLYGSR